MKGSTSGPATEGVRAMSVGMSEGCRPEQRPSGPGMPAPREGRSRHARGRLTQMLGEGVERPAHAADDCNGRVPQGCEDGGHKVVCVIDDLGLEELREGEQGQRRVCADLRGGICEGRDGDGWSLGCDSPGKAPWLSGGRDQRIVALAHLSAWAGRPPGARSTSSSASPRSPAYEWRRASFISTSAPP